MQAELSRNMIGNEAYESVNPHHMPQRRVVLLSGLKIYA